MFKFIIFIFIFLNVAVASQSNFPKNAADQVIEQGNNYETIAPSQTDQVLGSSGAVGDFLERLVCQVTAVGAGGQSSIEDGSGSAILITPPSTPIGVHVIELNIPSATGAWSVTTGASISCLAIGRFN